MEKALLGRDHRPCVAASAMKELIRKAVRKQIRQLITGHFVLHGPMASDDKCSTLTGGHNVLLGI